MQCFQTGGKLKNGFNKENMEIKMKSMENTIMS